MADSKYSFYDLEQKKNDLGIFIKKGSKYNRRLVYLVRTNVDMIVKDQEKIRESLVDNVEGFEDYQNRKFEEAVKAGGKAKTAENGSKYIANPEEIDETKFNKALEKLNKEFKDVVEKQDAIFKKNNEELIAKVSDLELRSIPLSLFPEEISFDELPQSTLELIKDDEE